MSLGHAPSIVQNGLVLYVDPSNLKRGFVGRPTTNLLAPYGDNFTAGWSTNAVTVTPNSCMSPDGQRNGTLMLVTATGGSRSVAIGQGPTAGGCFSISLKAANSTSCSVGVYTASAWAGGGSSGIISGPGSLSGSGSLWTVSGLSTTEWTRLYVQSTLAGNCYLYPGGTGNTTGYSVYAFEAQAEALPYPTPFTASARSVTQALYDMMNVNTPDVTNAGWDASNQMIFSGGSTYYINCGNNATLSFGDGNFNVSQWVKTSDTSAADYMVSISKYNIATSTGLWIQCSPTNRYVTFGWDGTVFHATTTSINNNVWRHVSCQRTGTAASEIYVDGTYIGTKTDHPTKSSNSASQLDIARLNGVSRNWNGSLGPTMIYNRALTATEIKQNFAAQRGRYGV